jgi:hypothetical protein
MGLQHIKNFLSRQLAFLKVTYLGEKISQVIQHSEIDHDKEVEEARPEAWQEYKTKNLQKLH